MLDAEVRADPLYSQLAVARAGRAGLRQGQQAAAAARAPAEQRALDEHAAAEQLREELASVRAEHRAELEWPGGSEAFD